MNKTTGNKKTALEQTVTKAAVRLPPFLVPLLGPSFLGYTNSGFARLANTADTEIGFAAYALGASIFFVGYVLFEGPSDLILHRLGTHVWLSKAYADATLQMPDAGSLVVAMRALRACSCSLVRAGNLNYDVEPAKDSRFDCTTP